MTLWKDALLASGVNGGSASWVDASIPAIDTDATGVGTDTLRIFIPWSTLVGASKSTFRLTLRGGASSVTASNVYIGVAGTRDADSMDFAATPVEVKFGGASGFTIGSGVTAVSDPITLAVGASDGIVVAFYQSAGASVRYSSADPLGYFSYFKSGNDANTVVTSGYSTIGVRLISVDKLEYQ